MTEKEEEYKVERQSPYPPNSWSWRMVDPRGVTVLINLKTDTANEAVKRYEGLVTILIDRGWEPASEGYTRPLPSNGNGNGPEDKPQEDEEHICEIHHVPMTKWEKEGRKWWSHKTDDPRYAQYKGWCKGEPPKEAS